MKGNREDGQGGNRITPRAELHFYGRSLIALVALGTGLALLYPGLGWLGGLRAGAGLYFTLFLPGYVARRLFFAGVESSWIETVGTSMGLGIALVVVTTLFTNLVMGIPLSSGTSMLSAASVVLFAYGWLILRSIKNTRMSNGKA